MQRRRVGLALLVVDMARIARRKSIKNRLCRFREAFDFPLRQRL